jgi:two-component system, LytTR family, sensor kinase
MGKGMKRVAAQHVEPLGTGNDQPPLVRAVSRELHRKTLILIALFVVIQFIMLTVRVAVVDLEHQREMAQARLVLVPAGALLCYAIFAILRRFRGQPFVRQALWGALLSAVAALFYGWIWSEILFALDADEYKLTSASIIYQAFYWYLFYFSWTTAYLALCYSITVREHERHASLLRAQAHEAQIRALRYQINPHFLFNTLNSIATLIGEDRSRAEAMVLSLSEFFRSSLAIDPMADVRLGDELALQQLYLEIEGVRFSDRLSFSIDCPPELAGALVPSLILQPLVENAIKHGVARSEGKTSIAIVVAQVGDMLRITIRDDAVPGNGSKAFEAGTGVGLGNVRNRLAARYGPRFSLRAVGGDPHGFCVILELPLSLSPAPQGG